jgi:hypothetical protein
MHTVVTTVAPEITRLSPRNGFNGFLRALPGDEFCLSPSLNGLTRFAGFASDQLGISNGCQDHTTSPYAATSTNPSTDHVLPASFGRGVEAPFVCAPVDRSQVRPALRLPFRANAAASTASHPASVTTRDPPLLPGKDGASW